MLSGTSSMSISEKDVLTVARLAKLDLTGDGVSQMTSELSKVLAYVDKLGELDTSDVPPTAQVTVERAPLRPDEPRDGVAKDDVLSEAPRSDEIGFLVPGFVDES